MMDEPALINIFSLTKKDFRVDFFRGSGAGGQNRNKRDTAVRITHIETGITSECQEERNQEQNKKRAFLKLAERLRPYISKKVAEITGQIEQERTRQPVDRVRTYHEPDNRVIDFKGNRFSYSATIGKGDIKPLIEGLIH